MKIIKIAILLLLAVLLFTACRKDQDIEVEEVPPTIEPELPVGEETPIELEEFSFTTYNLPRIDGSPATAPLAQAVACVLLGQPRESVADMMVFTRTTHAFRNLAAGLSDVLIVAEPPPGILDELAELEIEVDMAPIAVDALVFIVNASNPVENLTSAQLRDIYSGVITNWQQVGGDNVEIAAFQRNEEAASQTLMQKLVMDWHPMADAPMQSFFSIFDSEEGITAVKGFDGSIGALGYTLFYYAEEMKMAEGLKFLSVDGVTPGADTIADGSYPLLNPYYAVIDASHPEDSSVRILFNWLLSAEGQALISNEGYVSMTDAVNTESFTLRELRWNVKTDDSYLTARTPPFSMHTRFLAGQMPELVPAVGLGTVLHYTSAITMNDGSMRISKYGFVTIDGVVITDLIYDSITRAVYTKINTYMPRPAYHLMLGRSENLFYYDEVQSLNAASALDGSWITPFEYVDIVFSEDVIFMFRDHESFDIDVYNYNGMRLYNILELEWAGDISEDTLSEFLVYGVSEGYGFVELYDGTYGLMNVLTGDLRRTDFIGAFSFFEGLAAVVPSDGNDLWGFVNKGLEFVITPEFVHEAAFINGLAVVETLDGNKHLINKQAQELFSVTPEYFIIQHHDGEGFSVYSFEDWEYQRFYTNDFIEVELPADVGVADQGLVIHYISEGWYSSVTDDGTWLFTHNEAYLIPKDKFITNFVDGYLFYFQMDESFFVTGYGVMMPDGRDVLQFEEGVSITPVIVDGNVNAFILNTNTMYEFFIRDGYVQAVYRIVGVDGGLIKSGPGILSYDEALGLFYVQGTDHFMWLDMDGNTIISIPSMAYSFD